MQEDTLFFHSLHLTAISYSCYTLFTMLYTPSDLRYESCEQQRRGHQSNKSLPEGSHHHAPRPIRNSDINAGIRLGSLILDARLQRLSRPELDLNTVIRPFPTSSTSSSSSSSMIARQSRPSSTSSITQEILPLQIQEGSYQSDRNKPLPSPLTDKPLPLPTQSSFYTASSKPTWTMPADFDPRDYSIEPMSYWSDDSDDSDAEDAKKNRQHKRGSSKLTGIWRRSRNSKNIKATTTPTNSQFLDEVTSNLARLQ